MSKPGVNNPAAKQENSQVKKENRSSSGNTPNIKDEKRSSESLGNQQQKSNSSNQNQNRGGQTSNAQRSNQQRTNDSQNRDRSGNRNDNRHFEKNKPETKGNEEDKHSSDPSSTGVPTGEKKFTGRCRLFVGNLTPDISEDEFRKMFEAYGEVSEIYLNPSRGFGFIRLDYRQNAEAAKVGLDGSQRKGRVLRVRFATHGAALKVKNLHPFVSNELLEHSFSQFGELERCVVIVDDRGKSTGEGIVEFVRKPGANSALRRITEGVFLMGMDPKPVFVEPLEHKDEEDGLPEKLLTRNEQYKKEREKDPRFAPPGTFEFEFGMRWKQLDELEKQRVEQVKKDIENDRLKLEDEMQNALFEYQADQIRHELARQQEELRRLEELRNQDRLRRQQEYELRHQQEDRERAQQEERRRADTMMLMRQHELARGRAAGTMDMSALGREDMMMADRFGDRMPDRMPDRMADRMPDRMGEHMGDRMPERMGDRMPERMGDRMSSGQSGFMWDDKQREDTSPKSLMQAAGYNMGSAPGGGPGSGAPSMSQGPGAPDPNAMDEDCTEDTSISKSEDSQETNVSDLPSDELGKHEACLATFRSPDMQNEHCLHEDHDLQSDAQNSHVDNGMHVDLLDADLGSRSLRDAGDISNTASTSSQGKSSPHASSISEQSQSEAASELPSDDSTAKFASYEDGHLLTDPGSQTASNWKQPEDRGFSTPQVTCTERGSVKHSGRVVLPCSEVDTHCSHSADVLAADATIVRDSEDDSNNQMVVNVSSNCLNDTSDIDTNCQLRDFDCSADTEVYNQEDSVNQNVLVNSRTDQRAVTVHPQNNASLHLSSNPQSGLPSQYSRSPDCCGIDQVPHSTSFTGSQCLSHGALVPETVAAEESHDLSEASIEESGSHNQNICLSYEEASVEAHDREQSLSEEDQYEHSTGCHNEQSLESEPDSSNYTHPSLDCSTHDNYHVDSDSEVSSYRQHIANDAEEMDTGALDDEDVPDVTVNSSVYQSYEDDTDTQYEAGAAAVGLVDMPLVAHYDTTDSHITEVNPSEEVSNVAVLCSSPTVGDDTASSSTACVPLQDTVTDAATSPTEEVTTSTASSSPSLSSHQHIGSLSEQERMFSHGEQAFMAARQAASVPFVQAGCQMPYVPGMNPSMYAGAAMVQGLAGPTMMTSSSMHIAQHPGGGATIMQQHQSMSSGGMSQATLMQQQSMANGVQATSLMQRTLTNGGQTMLVQQRTMTTGLDGMTQQTMVQQQMATPGMQSAAMFHANAMRQRTLASQQASMMQQRIRLVQTGVVGNPMMHAQAMGGQTLIRGGNMPTLIQHGMLRGISQGTMMQQLVRQRYLGGPVMPGRGIQLMAGRPIRVKMTYPRESMQMDT